MTVPLLKSRTWTRAELDAWQAQHDAQRRAGQTMAVPEPSPAPVVVYEPEPPEPVNGSELLGYIAGYLGTYIAFPSTAAHVTAVLWNAHAAARDRGDDGTGPLIWRASPRLGVTSSVNKSGKSTVLDLSGMLQQVQRPTKITGRDLANKLGRKHEAVMLDEVKVLFGAGSASKDVQSVLLAGYTPRATWSYSRGNASVDIPCYGPVAYAAKDDLITATGDLLVDLFDRTVWLRMTRPNTLMPQPDEQAEDDGRMLGETLAQWTNSVKGQLKARGRELATHDYEASLAAAQDGVEVDGRTPQIWRPMLAVADVAGAPWPSLARQAMREMTEGAARIEGAGTMDSLRKTSRRWAPVGFLDS